jgi:LAS superfamily LD-carboxypeptidase LdcB
MNALELTGRARTHIAQIDEPRCALHREAVEAFFALRAEAAAAGFDLRVSSSYRDFAAQAAIWNRKFRGERTLYDRDGNPREHAALTPDELIDAILMWSALPGASRHHWGTDLDIFDRAAVPADYRVELLPAEYAPGGVFARLAEWLDGNLARFGFFRPYDRDRGGVNPEPWHISYAPLSQPATALLTADLVAEALADAELLGKALVLQRLPDIHRRYIANVAEPSIGGASVWRA